jgi:hypothetical protein
MIQQLRPLPPQLGRLWQGGWLGRGCLHWVPAKARIWEEQGVSQCDFYFAGTPHRPRVH